MTVRFATPLLSSLVALALLSCDSPGAVRASSLPEVVSASPASARLSQALVARVRSTGSARAVVSLDESRVLTAAGHGGGGRAMQLSDARRSEVMREARERLRGRHAGRGVQVERGYDNFAVAVVRVDSEQALQALSDDEEVTRVDEERRYSPSLPQSLALINQPTVASTGKNGSGYSVAVIDTGLDYTHAAFGACTAPGVPAACRVPFVRDFATDDGVRDADGHGTNVAAVVAGVAGGAQVIGLDVFGDGGFAYDSDILAAIDWVITHRSTYNIAAMNLSLGGGKFTSACDSVTAADFAAFRSAREAGILAAVASGNEMYTDALASPACLSNVISVGAVYDAAQSGTWTWGSDTTCSDSAIVADKVTCFSNSASFLTMLAPGAMITAGGYNMGGTSQAAPHVAGAIAVLKAAYPTETASQIAARLTSSGKAVVDSRNGLSKPRLDLAAAVGVVQCSYSLGAVPALPVEGGSVSVSVTAGVNCAWSVGSSAAWLAVTGSASGTGNGTVQLTAAANYQTSVTRTATLSLTGGDGTVSTPVSQGGDVVAPTGTVSINNGAAFTNRTAVTLSITGSDPSGVTQMCVTSSSSSCSTFEPFAASRSWTLASGDGAKTVYVWLRDGAGNTTVAAQAASDGIVLDGTGPSNGTVTFATASGVRSVTWSGFNDGSSGIGSYRVVALQGTTPPSSCSVGTLVYEGAATSVVDPAVVNGAYYSFRICALDQAGNLSTGATLVGSPLPETVPPTGAISLNGGATHTSSTTVSVAVAAQDASAITGICLTEATTCTAWTTYATPKSFVLSSAVGLKTVRVWLRDQWNNVTAAPLEAQITFDNVAPTGGAITATTGNAANALAWTGITDASPIASYRLVFSASATAPSSCTSGTLAYTGTATTFTHSGLTNGTTYSYRVCATDKAGNSSTGVIVSAMPAPEKNAPVGAVTINAGAAYTRTTSVTIALSATDASTITGVCLSATTTCTSWLTWGTSKSFTLPTGSGVRTVRAWFRDQWNNTSSTPVSDTIVLDGTAPTNGTITGTVGNTVVNLAWSGFSDATSGVARYKLVFATGSTIPSSCSSGTQAYLGTATTFSHTGRVNGTKYNYRVCAIDNAGNVSTGSTVSGMIPRL